MDQAHCAPSPSSRLSLIPLTLGLPSCRFPLVYDSGELTLVELCRIYAVGHWGPHGTSIYHPPALHKPPRPIAYLYLLLSLPLFSSTTPTLPLTLTLHFTSSHSTHTTTWPQLTGPFVRKSC
ncbi:hypothetical protein BHE90_011581 [Fusarium euwallaceae]|uniref:Uncharacterized protein n=4 Tax=Fusarium solani species complex TaxID=232080 RepID=A0A3M2S6B2_9HYPO|nr:hypothetical protein CDV36_007262 [Fusarium kuroshium]RSL76328.1 hypothetical protein CEP51_010063 [Fusarium floridanum]RSL98784.1 hypothetical protein CDV31_012461 [Fusarium ambrosium]RTE73982.1 hypothetical protein BHE90_011581 [Fusarium euwallaceae]